MRLEPKSFPKITWAAGLLLSSLLQVLAAELFFCIRKRIKGKAMTPHKGNWCSLSFLSAFFSSWFQTLGGLFELTRRSLQFQIGIELIEGQTNDNSSGKYFFLPFLPATPSCPSWTLVGLFELTLRPSRALASLHALLLELQRTKDTVKRHHQVRRARRRGPRASVKNDSCKPCLCIF